MQRYEIFISYLDKPKKICNFAEKFEKNLKKQIKKFETKCEEIAKEEVASEPQIEEKKVENKNKK